MAVGVLVVAEVRLFRDLLSDTLARREDLEILGSAGAGGEAVERLHSVVPDVVVLDARTPDALAGMRMLRAASPGLRIVTLAVPELEAELLEWVEAGVAGCVTEDAGIDQLVEAIRSAARGEAVCSPRMTAALFRRVAALSAERRDARPDAVLTSREREVMSLLEQGLSNKEIARRLSIELSTVKNHVHNILEKLGVGRRAEAVAQLIPARTRSFESEGSRTG